MWWKFGWRIFDSKNNRCKNLVSSRRTYKLNYELTNYVEHNLESSSKAEAAAYVSVKFGNKEYWGTGIHDDIICASIYALISAINNALKDNN